jgi:hypothetical protein
MNDTDAFSKPGERRRPPAPPGNTVDVYEGIDLAPRTLESLVTWDVSGHAQREQDRMTSTYRTAGRAPGGY